MPYPNEMYDLGKVDGKADWLAEQAGQDAYTRDKGLDCDQYVRGFNDGRDEAEKEARRLYPNERRD